MCGSSIYSRIDNVEKMIPIITKENEVLWHNVKFANGNTINNVATELHKKFNDLYNKMKMYIDVYNFTLFGYENAYCLLDEQTEPYDVKYSLNDDIKCKCLEYRKELNSSLEIIHKLFNDVNELLTIKHIK